MPATKKQPKQKRLKRGRDWHAWAWRLGKEDDWPKKDHGMLFCFADAERPKKKPTTKGRWVRVKFTEVPAVKKGD